jgi:hypothetical protein
MINIMAIDVRPGNAILGVDGSIPLYVRRVANQGEEIIFDCSYSQEGYSVFPIRMTANMVVSVSQSVSVKI